MGNCFGYQWCNCVRFRGKTAGAIVGGIIGAIVLVGLVVIVVLYLRCRSAQSEENKARIHAKIIGTPIDELEVAVLIVLMFGDNNVVEMTFDTVL